MLPETCAASYGTGDCIRVSRLSDCDDVARLQAIVVALWDILDDIDTIDDMVRDDDEMYREMVSRVQTNRLKYLETDGYDLYLPE